AAGDAPPRPSRRAQRSESALTLAEPVEAPPAEPPEPAAGAATPVSRPEPSGERLPVPPPVRHLTVVPAPAETVPGPAEVIPPRRTGGRNLPAAIGVGLALGAVILATLTLYRPSFGWVILAAVGVGIYEIVAAIAGVEARPSLVPLLAGAAAMEGAAWFRGPDGLVG